MIHEPWFMGAIELAFSWVRHHHCTSTLRWNMVENKWLHYGRRFLGFQIYIYIWFQITCNFWKPDIPKDDSNPKVFFTNSNLCFYPGIWYINHKEYMLSILWHIQPALRPPRRDMDRSTSWRSTSRIARCVLCLGWQSLCSCLASQIGIWNCTKNDQYREVFSFGSSFFTTYRHHLLETLFKIGFMVVIFGVH